MIFCQQCGFANPPQHAFCGQCGQALVRTCGTCGASNPAAYRFCGTCGRRLGGEGAREAAPEGEPARLGAAAGAVPQPALAERRQLTVMFCDLVGSTALSLQLDPEDLREVVQAYQKMCAGIIEQYEGYIAQYLGDGILVYFGYPVAHEGEAERAVRAGLSIVRGIKKMSRRFKRERGVDLAVRIGVHTGVVVVGEVGGGTRREHLALGEAPNVAARLQSIAQPNTLVLSSTTYRLVADGFECEDLGPFAFKGLPGQASAYRVIEEKLVGSLSLGLAGAAERPIGREQELELLLAHWRRLGEGAGQIVVVRGEAGIGKSYLVQQFRQQLAGTPHNEFVCRGSSFHQSSAFFPFVDLLQRMLNFYPEQSSTERLDMLTFVLERNGFEVAEALPLFAALLGVPLEDRVALLGYSPQLQKDRTQDALVRLLLKQAEERPLLLLVEDLHWVDPSSRAVLQRLIHAMQDHRVLLLLTTRPEEMRLQLPEGPSTEVALERLREEQVEHLIQEVAGGKRLPPPLVAQITRRTDGVPLFVQELTKMVLESGLLVEHEDHFELDGDLRELSIPATLQDSLMARLDRLSPVKELAQLCATIGREFSFELLLAVSQLDEAVLRNALARLVDAELLFQHGTPPAATYVFRHALLQEAAYTSLLKSQRLQHHRRIAEQLEVRFPRIAEQEPELVAYHYTRGGLGSRGAHFWLEAGRRALQQSANAEAVDYLGSGLAGLEEAEHTDEHLHLRLHLQAGLASALLQLKGYTHPEVRTAYEEARLLCERLTGAPERIQVLRGLWSHYTVAGQHGVAEDLARQLVAQVRQSGSEAQMLEAKRAVASTQFWRGDVAAARDLLQEALTAHANVAVLPPPSLVAEHPTVGCLAYLSHALWYLGFPDQALRQSREAVLLAQHLQHPFSEVLAMGFDCALHAYLGDEAAVAAKSRLLTEQAQRYGFAFWLGIGSILQAWTGIAADPDAGVQRMKQGLESFHTAGVRIWTSQPVVLLAQKLLAHGRAAEGLPLVDRALQGVKTTHEYLSYAELQRVRGELLIALGQLGEGAGCLQVAAEYAGRQQAKALELRALMSLARLTGIAPAGAAPGVPGRLRRVYESFTEGRTTPDLQAAGHLLQA